jgi:hypothetical protein
VIRLALSDVAYRPNVCHTSLEDGSTSILRNVVLLWTSHPVIRLALSDGAYRPGVCHTSPEDRSTSSFKHLVLLSLLRTPGFMYPRGEPTILGPLQRAYLNPVHWLRLALSGWPYRVGISPHPMRETDVVSETSCFSIFRISDDGQWSEPQSCEGYTPSSDTFVIRYPLVPITARCCMNTRQYLGYSRITVIVFILLL